MSHHAEENTSCPNCGFHTTHNYCAQCGQEVHLHKDSFWGLVMHFIGHYFHYDSKFWQTMKALLFSPGKLTIAYKDKQRMRYIPPISLYIFISAVFFLVASFDNSRDSKDGTAAITIHTDSVTTHNIRQAPKNKELSAKVPVAVKNTLVAMREKVDLMESDDRYADELLLHFLHNLPKVFFFMIPVMAAILSLLFITRKNIYFADHIIFSLHFQSLFFTLLIFNTLISFDAIYNYMAAGLFLVTFLYFTKALKNVYKTGWIKAVLFSAITSLFYCIVLISAIVFTLIAL